mmetsp:Transcript_12508/g.22117  ORF Transcript_12508/g.22117 Transcript_12508/m.22117 type:complete len:206 (+) Transcript_12508:194-811(+)
MSPPRDSKTPNQPICAHPSVNLSILDRTVLLGPPIPALLPLGALGVCQIAKNLLIQAFLLQYQRDATQVFFDSAIQVSFYCTHQCPRASPGTCPHCKEILAGSLSPAGLAPLGRWAPHYFLKLTHFALRCCVASCCRCSCASKISLDKGSASLLLFMRAFTSAFSKLSHLSLRADPLRSHLLSRPPLAWPFFASCCTIIQRWYPS